MGHHVYAESSQPIGPRGANVKSEDFLRKFNELERKGVVDDVRELVQALDERTEELEDLDNEHRKLSAAELADLQQHDTEIAEKLEQEIEQISNAEYNGEDSEEAEESMEMSLRDAQIHYEELIAGNRGPAFAESLKQQIEEIEEQLQNLIGGN